MRHYECTVKPTPTASRKTILSCMSCLKQPHVKEGQVISEPDGDWSAVTWGNLQSSGVGSKNIWFASAFPSIQAIRPNSERHRDLVLEESGGCLVMQLISAFLTKLCHALLSIATSTTRPVRQFAVHQRR